jgi:general secretion pathway protein C
MLERPLGKPYHCGYMAETRIQDWLARLPKNGPWIVSAALALLIAVELGRVALIFLGGNPVKSIAPVRSVSRVAPVINVQSLVDAHLFGVAAPGENSASDPNDAPATTANLVLAGTIAVSDPKKGIAIIGDGGAAKVYSVGQSVGGYTLHSVYLDRVLLDRGGGALEALLLPKLPPVGGVVQPAAFNQAQGGDPQTAAMVDNIRKLVAHDPDLLREVIRTVPSFDSKAGRLKGFRAYPGKSREAFVKLGLSPGDLIVAVNGSPLDDPSHTQDLLNIIQSSSTATLTIEHLGKRKDLTLNVAQVAAQASRDLDIDTNNMTPVEQAAPLPGPNDDSDN